MDFDTPSINDWLDTIADAENNFAFAAVSYKPAEGWEPGGFHMLLVHRSGRVEELQRPVRRKEARAILQRTADMVLEERWDSKKQRWVYKVDAKRDGARPKRVGLSPRTRWEVLERDGRRCRYCGANAPDTILHVDHVKSKKDGGTDDLANLVTACQDCNLGKGARSA